MKIVKRDGRIVEYNREKIYAAIKNANRDVKEEERATDKEINKIIKYIEDLNKKRILVEDIQDIIETELMKLKRFNLAKEYIIYRYKRTLVRKRNTTDESLLSIIKNKNNNESKKNKSVLEERNLIAGEVSKDLSKRILWPSKIRDAHENGMIFFHDAEYFIHPMINNTLINYDDMLENGTIINNIVIDKPKSFYEACNLLGQIVLNTMDNIYGSVVFNIKYLAKYLNKKKDLVSGIKTLMYELMCNTKKKESPSIIILLEIDCEETSQIIDELFNQLEKIQFENQFNNSIELIYLINKDNLLNGKYYFLTKKAISLTKKISIPSYGTKKSLELKKKFNEGIVTINLVQVAKEVKGNEELFWKLLDERLDLCYDALLCKYHYLLGTTSDVSPILWQYGGIKRLDKKEKIDKALNNDSCLTLGYVGLIEATKLISKDIFTEKLIKYLKKKCNDWSKETNLCFNVYPTNNKTIFNYFLKIDQEKYDDKNLIEEKYYNTFYNQDIDILDRIKLDNKIGPITYVNLNKNTNIENILELINDNEQYVKFINKENYERKEY